MGEIKKYKCDNCGYEVEAWLGIGFMSFKNKNDKKFIKELIKMSNTECFKDLLTNHIDEIEIIESREMYQCEECNTLEEHKCITIECHKEINRTNAYCEKCGKPMLLVKEKGFANCPICKKKLSEFKIGYWD